MTAHNWLESFLEALRNLWFGLIDGLVVALGAIIVLVIGLVIASGIAKLVERLLRITKIDGALVGLGVKEHLERGGLSGWDLSKFIGKFIYWFLVIVTLLAVSDILGFASFSEFLRDVLLYLPNVIVAVLIMLAAFLLGNFLRKLVRASIKSAHLHGEKFLGALTWWAVVIFGLLAAFSQLGIAVDIINYLIVGFIAVLALSCGIAFGLGGKDHASDLLNKLKEREEE